MDTAASTAPDQKSTALGYGNLHGRDPLELHMDTAHPYGIYGPGREAQARPGPFLMAVRPFIYGLGREAVKGDFRSFSAMFRD